MAAADKILKNFALFLDGTGYIGRVDSAKIPALTVSSEEFRAGGMDAPVKLDMGMEALDAEFTLSGYEPLAVKLFGKLNTPHVPLTLRGSLEDLDGTVTPLVVNLAGVIHGLDPAEMQPGQKSAISFTMSLHTLKWTQAGETLIEIDIPNMVRIVGGVDQLAAKRDALGI